MNRSILVFAGQLLVVLLGIGLIFSLFGQQPPLVSVLFLFASAVALEAERLTGVLTGVWDMLAHYGQFGLLAPAMLLLADQVCPATATGVGQLGSYLLAVAVIILLRDRLACWLQPNPSSRAP